MATFKEAFAKPLIAEARAAIAEAATVLEPQNEGDVHPDDAIVQIFSGEDQEEEEEEEEVDDHPGKYIV